MKEAREKFNGDKFSFVTGSALDIPFEPESFDLVCISKGMHHVPDTQRTLSEMLRVTRRFGSVLVSEMYSDGLSTAQETAKMYHHLRVEVDTLLGIDHFNTFTREELMAMMSMSGLYELGVFEYLEQTSDPFDPVVFREYVGKMEGWIEELSDPHQKADIASKLRAVEVKMKKDGFAKPPLLIFWGTKK
jgi:ubiquinone/menaquinone biosynthesis C-methylase UbiE